MALLSQERQSVIARARELAEQSKSACDRSKYAIARSKELQQERADRISQKEAATRPPAHW
jgi:hypothetical protein